MEESTPAAFSRQMRREDKRVRKLAGRREKGGVGRWHQDCGLKASTWLPMGSPNEVSSPSSHLGTIESHALTYPTSGMALKLRSTGSPFDRHSQHRSGHIFRPYVMVVSPGLTGHSGLIMCWERITLQVAECASISTRSDVQSKATVVLQNQLRSDQQ